MHQLIVIWVSTCCNEMQVYKIKLHVCSGWVVKHKCRHMKQQEEIKNSIIQIFCIGTNHRIGWSSTQLVMTEKAISSVVCPLQNKYINTEVMFTLYSCTPQVQAVWCQAQLKLCNLVKSWVTLFSHFYGHLNPITNSDEGINIFKIFVMSEVCCIIIWFCIVCIVHTGKFPVKSTLKITVFQLVND